MSKEEKNVICMILIYVIIISAYFIYRINQSPEYNQELFDEICSQYDKIKQENKTGDIDARKSNNPTFLTVKVQDKTYKIIGTIIIDKIDIEYPIIAETTDENLKIAPTKLCGPLINTTGNLCIIGHNYVNGKLFSNLSKLKNGDKVTLIDNNENAVNYQVYEKYVIPSDDVECLNQDTNGEIEVTLITCTNKNDERLVVKARKIN